MHTSANPGAPRGQRAQRRDWRRRSFEDFPPPAHAVGFGFHPGVPVLQKLKMIF